MQPARPYSTHIAALMTLGMLVQIGAAGAIVRQIVLNPGIRHWGVTTWALAGPSLLTAMLAFATLCFQGRRPWVWVCLLISCAIGASIIAVDRTGRLIEYERWIQSGMP